MDDSKWLLNLPEFASTSRPEVERWRDARLTEWLNGYRERIEIGTESDDFRRRATSRMWHCWRHHWKRSEEYSSQGHGPRLTGDEVASLLRQGVRPTNRQSLGGDPLLDCALVDGVLSRDEACVTRLRDTATPVLRAQCRRWGEPDDDEWEHDFWVSFCGFDERDKTPRIDSFQGYVAFGVWLKRVVQNAIVDRYRKCRRELGLIDHRTEVDGLAAQPASSVLYQMVVEHARPAWARLSKKDRSLLLWRYRDGWRLNDVAGQLEISEGHASRICGEAEARFGHAFQELAELDSLSPEHVAVLQRNSTFLARTLVDQLPAPASPLTESTDKKGIAMNAPKKQPKPIKSAKSKVAGKSARRKLAESETLEATSGGTNMAGWVATAKPLPDSSATDSRMGGRMTTPLRDRVSPPSPEKVPDPWERILPTDSEWLESKTDMDPDAIFADQAARPPGQRPRIVCLDGRGKSASAVNTWIGRFLENRDAQDKQVGTTVFDPLLVVLCDQKSSLANAGGWNDFQIIHTDDSRTDCRQIFASATIARMQDIESPLPRSNSVDDPGTEEVAFEDIMSPEGLAELDALGDDLQSD